MGQKLNYRLNDLIRNGIHIVSLQGRFSETVQQTRGALPYDVEEPTSNYVELLRSFEDRGLEFIIGEKEVDASEITEALDHKTLLRVHHKLTRTAFNYAKKIGIIDRKSPEIELTDNFKLEVYAIDDPESGQTFYFALPHRDYLKSPALIRKPTLFSKR